MTYRASPIDGAAWVTGASAGLGRAVARELARRGFAVFATARRAEALSGLAEEARGLAGRIFARPGDVTDRAGVAALVGAIERESPIALAVLNAGGSFRDPPGDFGGEGFQRTFKLNLQGAVNCANPVFNAMRDRKRGQIAFVASLVGYGGLPNAGAYGPSKAAIISLAESLKFAADRCNVTIQVVNPGFVRTELTADVKFRMPLLMEAEAAARRLCDGLERGGFEIRFPRRLAWAMRAARALPYPLYFTLLKMARGG